ncbi:hypothetical protein TRAPUB_4209 [Trametes pubescens]|uniref:Uncharacterized protein n=1 Tax=Trametes pubescens TaxID=154538 RepID=A0A1M2VBU4_TRAPU|nr:hypothetical protein TRAPUB_4209 [Trametes pubescens]
MYLAPTPRREEPPLSTTFQRGKHSGKDGPQLPQRCTDIRQGSQRIESMCHRCTTSNTMEGHTVGIASDVDK